MSPVSVIVFIAGIALGIRYSVVALVPAILICLGAGIVASFSDGLAILPSIYNIAIAITLLEVGYFIGCVMGDVPPLEVSEASHSSFGNDAVDFPKAS